MSAVTSEKRVTRKKFSLNRSQIYGILYLLVAVFIIFVFAQAAEPGQMSTFRLTPPRSEALPVPDLIFPSQISLYVFAVIVAFVGGWQLAKGFQRLNLVLVFMAILFVIAFLTWAARGRSLNFTSLMANALLRATPIALAGLSGVLCERAAVINIAIEGMMLSGAFTTTIAASIASNLWAWSDGLSLLFGLIVGLLTGGLLGLVLAVLAVRYKVDQIVAGTAINILSTGITSFLVSRILVEFQNLNQAPIFPKISLPLLSRIPILGPVLFNQNLLFYLMFVVIAAIHIMLFYTRWGLRTRAVGEHPKAADTLGVRVYFTRYVNTILGGMVAGLGGAFLVIGSVGRFDEVMTAGKGFIGLAAMIFGKWMPFGVFGAASIFGFADSLQSKLAILDVPIPSQFLLMAPYLITIIVLAGVIGEAIPPAADGQPYVKE